MQRRTETEITKNWPADNDKPLVTVIAICYCHEKYLRPALDGILAQETDFPFEAVVHDDASPDGSADIIREYAEAYPRIIRPVLETENRFSKGPAAMLQAIKPYIRGKYIAFLECDDFWTDPHKLQRQADFLEEHPAYLAVSHNCTVVDAEGNPTGEPYPECKENEYTSAHFLRNILPGQFATLFVRDFFSKSTEDNLLIQSPPPGPFDRAFCMTLLFTGRIFCIQKSMSAYRHITSGGTSYSAVYRFDIARETRFYLLLALYCKRMGRTGEAIGLLRYFVHLLQEFIDRGAVSKEKAAPYLDRSWTSISALTDLLTRRDRLCSCCGERVLYLPLPFEEQERALSFSSLFLPETLNPDAFLCPNCGSTDRERLLAAALERMGLRQKGQEYRVLQIAPSSALDRWLRKQCPNATTEGVDVHADLQDLSAVPDGRYDLILCSHVLEHVQDDRRALREMKRILKEDGCILLLVPVDLGFSGVDEAWGLSEQENQRRFGQGDRVRRYSREGLSERLSEQLAVQRLGKDWFGDDCFWQAGLSDSSALYVLCRPGHSAFV